MKIAILGAGGVGGYFGGRLAAAGADVTFVARGAHLEALRTKGLRIASALGDLTLPVVKAVDNVAKVETVDLVIVGVKLWDTELVAQTLKPIAASGAAVISFQNGVQKDEILGAQIAADAIMSGVCYIAATIAEPGVIAHTGTMQRLVFGERDGRRSVRGEALLDACRRAGIDADLSDVIERRIWEKFVFLVGLSGTTSLLGRPIGEIRAATESRTMLRDAMAETVNVGRARGVPLAADFSENRLAFCDTLPAAMTSSMQVDLSRRSRLELPWLSGAVVDMGRALGVATPVNQSITEALAPYIHARA